MVSYRDDGVQCGAYEVGVGTGGADGDESGVALKAGPDDELEALGVRPFACGQALDLGAQVIGAAFWMEIEGLHGRDKLGNIEVCSLVKC